MNVSEALERVSPGALVTYLVLCSIAHPVSGLVEAPVAPQRKGKGRPPRGAQQHVAKITGFNKTTIWRQCCELEAAKLLRRNHLHTSLWVHFGLRLGGVLSPRLCEGCGVVIQPSRQWCRTCAQTVGRVDRQWRVRAIELAVAGKSPAQIAVVLGVSLWGHVGDDDTEGQAGVVPVLHQHGLLGRDRDQWLDAWQEASPDTYRAYSPKRRSRRKPLAR